MYMLLCMLCCFAFLSLSLSECLSIHVVLVYITQLGGILVRWYVGDGIGGKWATPVKFDVFTCTYLNLCGSTQCCQYVFNGMLNAE